MKLVPIQDFPAQAADLLAAAEAGEEVVIARDGTPVARLSAVPAADHGGKREPGSWRKWPGWENFVYDPSVFAPMTDEEMREEGWPVD